VLILILRRPGRIFSGTAVTIEWPPAEVPRMYLCEQGRCEHGSARAARDVDWSFDAEIGALLLLSRYALGSAIQRILA